MRPSTASLSAHLDRYLKKEARRRSRDGLPPPQVLVLAPGTEYVSGDRAMPFHAASVGKLATAALVLQEARRGLDLDTPVERVLPAAETAGLFAGPGATVRHLLAHTSGVADYFGGRSRGPRFVRQVLDHPDHSWEPADLVAFTRERQQPVGRPGERFAYSDTGYVLLGRLLEERSGRDFAGLLRARVLEPARMSDTVLWLREPGPVRIAPLWLDGVEASTFRSLSCDWAGGGLVTTLDDLARLGSALTGGRVVESAQWAEMVRPRHRFRHGIRYGLGTMELRLGSFAPLLRTLGRPVGHLGVLGTHLFLDPRRGSTVVLNFHDTREMVASFRTHIRIAQGLAGTVAAHSAASE